MAHTVSIQTEIIRGELQRDCTDAGYSDGDARRLADRIIGGWITPGLAVALEGRQMRDPNRRDEARQTVEAM
jgi:hypothetical protein